MSEFDGMMQGPGPAGGGARRRHRGTATAAASHSVTASGGGQLQTRLRQAAHCLLSATGQSPRPVSVLSDNGSEPLSEGVTRREGSALCTVSLPLAPGPPRAQK